MEQDRNMEAVFQTVYKLAFAMMKNPHDADDVFQEVFLRYFKKNPVFESEAHQKAWFIRVTVNCCKNYWTSPWNTRTVGLGVQEETGIMGADGESVLFACEEDKRVFEAVRSLPDKYRVLIHLFYYEDMSVEEISCAVNRKPATVRTQLVRARDRLKELLGTAD